MLPRAVCLSAFLVGVSMLTASVGASAQDHHRSGWAAGSGCPTGSAACDGPTGGAAAMARPAAPAFHPPAMPQRPAMAPSPGASHGLTATAPGPALRGTTAASCPARGGTAT